MKRMILIFFACIFFLNTFGQVTTKELNNVRTIEQANHLISTSPGLNARLFTITSDIDTSDITLPLFSKKAGFSFTIDDFTYKIIDTASYPEFRVSYIYLDGNQLSEKTIDSLQKEIINKYRSGTYFFDLVREYTMDGHHNGDLGWFAENMMAKEFEVAVRSHKKNDIFTVNIPERKWYYVTLKTYDDRRVKKLTILKVKSGK